MEDVYDICWCPDSQCLVAGSIDNQAIIWNVSTKERLRTLDGHNHYVQGVAWDPLNQYICTQSSDRTCRIYTTEEKTKKRSQVPVCMCVGLAFESSVSVHRS